MNNTATVFAQDVKKEQNYFGYSQDEMRDAYEKEMGQKLEDYESICQLCYGCYDRSNEQTEVAESGEYFCNNCWEIEE